MPEDRGRVIVDRMVSGLYERVSHLEARVADAEADAALLREQLRDARVDLEAARRVEEAYEATSQWPPPLETK